MAKKPNWFYDEMKHSGVDYSDPAQVAIYDGRHQKFRDYKKDAEAILRAIKIEPEHTVIDMGVGTGAFSLNAAPYCKTIYAADVSPVMLAYTRQKAEQAGLTNLVFCQGGFLTYEHPGPGVDAIVSVAVLHHLPDFWKFIGLQRMAQMLKAGGRFYLFDVVFPSDMKDYESQFGEWIRSMTKLVGAGFAAEMEAHLRDEYSTYDWVLEGYLTRAGFRIDEANHTGGYNAAYLCTKVG